jgi:hypothetical protein
MTCKKCKTEMQPGIALVDVATGIPDFDKPVTMSYSGAVKLVHCLKCGSCGWSVTAEKEQTDER